MYYVGVQSGKSPKTATSCVLRLVTSALFNGGLMPSRREKVDPIIAGPPQGLNLIIEKKGKPPKVPNKAKQWLRTNRARAIYHLKTHYLENPNLALLISAAGIQATELR
jgi:hypothetical protein